MVSTDRHGPSGEQSVPASVDRRALSRMAQLVVLRSADDARPYRIDRRTVFDALRVNDAPVLALAPMAQRPFAIAVAATDFGAASTRAIALAASLMTHAGVMHLAHVFPKANAEEEPAWSHACGVGSDASFAQLEARVHAVRPDLDVRRHLLEGDVASEVLHLSRALHPDLVLCGRRRHALIDPLRMPCVATRVLRHAHCSVLLLPFRSPHSTTPRDDWSASLVPQTVVRLRAR